MQKITTIALRPVVTNHNAFDTQFGEVIDGFPVPDTFISFIFCKKIFKMHITKCELISIKVNY